MFGVCLFFVGFLAPQKSRYPAQKKHLAGRAELDPLFTYILHGAIGLMLIDVDLLLLWLWGMFVFDVNTHPTDCICCSKPSPGARLLMQNQFYLLLLLVPVHDMWEEIQAKL